MESFEILHIYWLQFDFPATRKSNRNILQLPHYNLSDLQIV